MGRGGERGLGGYCPDSLPPCMVSCDTDSVPHMPKVARSAQLHFLPFSGTHSLLGPLIPRIWMAPLLLEFPVLSLEVWNDSLGKGALVGLRLSVAPVSCWDPA